MPPKPFDTRTVIMEDGTQVDVAGNYTDDEVRAWYDKAIRESAPNPNADMEPIVDDDTPVETVATGEKYQPPGE